MLTGWLAEMTPGIYSLPSDFLFNKYECGCCRVVHWVVLFVPVEGALSMALQWDPQTLECALSKNIIFAFPASLVSILKGSPMSIQQA